MSYVRHFNDNYTSSDKTYCVYQYAVFLMQYAIKRVLEQKLRIFNSEVEYTTALIRNIYICYEVCASLFIIEKKLILIN
jgi:hypothetical protein